MSAVGEEPEEQQQAGDGGSEYITLKVIGHDMNEIHLRVKMTTPMAKVMKKFSDTVGEELNTLRFLFDCRRLTGEQTLQQLKMENDDVIEVYKALGRR